ncbi:hypothetical protein AKJ16_DCAP10381 [Drosera capensis]
MQGESMLILLLQQLVSVRYNIKMLSALQRCDMASHPDDITIDVPNVSHLLPPLLLQLPQRLSSVLHRPLVRYIHVRIVEANLDRSSLSLLLRLLNLAGRMRKSMERRERAVKAEREECGGSCVVLK